MKKLSAMITFAASLILGGAVAGVGYKNLCEGIVPPNDLNIPVSLMTEGNLTETDFNEVLDVVEQYYTSVVSNKGATLEVRRLWQDGTVNASAMQYGSTWIINMYGGLARHPTITRDGFMLVACHEMGHHLGGAPKAGMWGWASNEGQADYYSSLKCLRFLLKDQDNFEWVETHTVDPFAMQRCQELYNTQEEENLCARISMAGKSVSFLFQALREEETAPEFNTPDPKVVNRTNNNHPQTQCRLDTYFGGSLCVHDVNSDLDDSDPTQGTCSRAHNNVDGVRPLCWYKPN